jgi:hypothetical protein
MMKQSENFTMRIGPAEQIMLNKLAAKFNRSKSDFLRVVIRELWADLPKHESTNQNSAGSPNPQNGESLAN